MQKNIYRAVFRRENLVLKAIFDLVLAYASYPRLVLEAFIRRDFGRRYFKLSSVVTVAIVLSALPPIINFLQKKSDDFLRSMNADTFPHSGEPSFWGMYTTWYIFVLLFIWVSYKRSREIYTHANVYDFNRFSLSSGIIDKRFYRLPIFVTPPTTYMVEVFLEPCFFILIGLVLELVGQPIGGTLISASIWYGISYAASYKRMDDYLQDIIDMRIMGEELERSFINGLPPDTTRGVHFKRRPSSEDLRRKMASQFFSEEDVSDAEYTVV